MNAEDGFWTVPVRKFAIHHSIFRLTAIRFIDWMAEINLDERKTATERRDSSISFKTNKKHSTNNHLRSLRQIFLFIHLCMFGLFAAPNVSAYCVYWAYAFVIIVLLCYYSIIVDDRIYQFNCLDNARHSVSVFKFARIAQLIPLRIFIFLCRHTEIVHTQIHNSLT